MAESQMSDRQLLELISKKVSVMDEKLNSIVGRIDKVENEVLELQTHVEELDRGVSFIETEFQEQKSKIKFKFSKESNQMFHDNGFGEIFSLKIICIIYMLQMFLPLQYFYKFWHG